MEIKNTNSNMDWGAAAGAAVSLMGNLIGSGMTNKRMRAAQRRQHEYAVDLMERQQQYNIENFNMENEYNSPLAQRERMKAAGLNPNFVDGLSPVVGQLDSPAVASGAAGEVAPSGLDNIANAAATFASIKRENDLAKSQIKLNESAKEKNIADANKAASDTAMNDNKIQYMWDYQAPNTNSQTLYYNQQRDESIARVNEINQNLIFTKEKVEAFVKSIDSAIKKNEAEITNMEELRRFVEERLPYEIAKLDADTKKAAVDAYCNEILARNDSMRVRIEQQNANANTMNAGSNRITALANRRNAETNSQVGKAQIALFGAQQRLAESNAELTDGKVVYQSMYNALTEELRSSGLDYALQNAILWKMYSEKDEIESRTFRNKQEAELFADTYFFKILQEIPGVGIFMK